MDRGALSGYSATVRPVDVNACYSGSLFLSMLKSPMAIMMAVGLRTSIFLRSLKTATTEERNVPGNFELYKDKGGKFRFRLKASNGQIILVSQGYKTKVSAKNGIGAIQRNSAVDARFERKSSKGKFMFNLKATNGQVVGTSERYDTERACENGIKSVAKNAPGAKIEDLAT